MYTNGIHCYIQTSVAKALLQHEKIDPNISNKHGETPLHEAVANNNADVAKPL